MQRWGKTPQGRQRFRCRLCRASGIRLRPDNQLRLWRGRFISWITGNAPLVDHANRHHVSVRTLYRKFSRFWFDPPVVRPPDNAPPRVVVLDGTTVVRRQIIALIAQDADRKQPIGLLFVVRECFEAWCGLLVALHRFAVSPSFIVCDGQRGLLAAIRSVWPQALIQRCVIHIHRQSRLWLTKEPKTKAGRELLNIVDQLLLVRTLRQKRRWIRSFRRWQRRHNLFLKERSWSPEGTRWWYTHRKLRAVRSLLRNSIPDLFRYVRFPGVPRTTNHVEGGVNSRLKELIRSHRGIQATKRMALTSWFLASRKNQH